jgi:putative transcriptional regulator
MNTAFEVRRKQKKPVRSRSRGAQSRRFNSADAKILAGLEDGLALIEGRAAAGTLGNVRLVYLPDPPAEYTASAVIALRERLGVSQIAFARLLGASLSLVQSWEQGRRSPNPMACRLLDEVARDPARWARMAGPTAGSNPRRD